MTSSIPSQSQTGGLENPAPAVSSVPTAKKISQTQKPHDVDASTTISIAPDQWKYHPVKARRLGDQQIRLLNNVLELVESAEVLLKAADQNKDQHLSRSELAIYRVDASQNAEARFTQNALKQKLLHHFDAIDSNKDGLDTQDFERLRGQALGQSEQIQNIAAVPVKEMALQESVREMPAKTPYTLTQSDTHRAYRFASRFQPFDAASVADFQQLDLKAQRYRLELTGHDLEMIQPIEPPLQGILPTPESVAEAISALPPMLQQYILTLELNPLPYTFQVEGQKDAHRADMTASPGGKITIYPRTQQTPVLGIYRTLIHESAHLMGFEKFGAAGTEEAWNVWRSAMTDDGIAPSTYARINGSKPGIEDLAEAVTAWILSQGQSEHEEWRALMPARFDILDKLLKGSP